MASTVAVASSLVGVALFFHPTCLRALDRLTIA
jgi:hypothetical protein